MYNRRHSMSRVSLAKTHKRAKIAAHRLNEICGVLVREHKRLHLVPVKNVSPYMLSFIITRPCLKTAMAAANLNSNDIVGAYHSHPLSEPVPSEGDLKGARNRWLILIIPCYKGYKISLWYTCNGKCKKLHFSTIV